MNNLVWTSISKGINQKTIYDWIISLRSEGKYKGKVLILNYGAEPSIINFIKKYNVNIIDIDLNEKDEKFIVNYRYIDIIPILEEQYLNYNTAHFDVDIWFQDDINPLFNDIEKAKGCLFSTEITNEKYTFNFNNSLDDQLLHKLLYIKRKYKGYINGGFIAGKSNLVLDKFKEFNKLIEQKLINYFKFGSDQSFIQYHFDIYVDKIVLKYNFMVNDYNINKLDDIANNLYYNNERLVGIHLSENKKERKNLNYDNLYYHKRYVKYL